MNPTRILLVGCLGLLLAYGCYLWVFRARSTRTVELHLNGDDRLSVEVERSRRLFWGSHVIGFGGGDPRITLRFIYRGAPVKFEGERYWVPRALQLYEGELLLAVQAGLSVTESKQFYFYRYDEAEWAPSSAAGFPLELAVCNLSSTPPQEIGYPHDAQERMRQVIRAARETRK